MITLNTEIFVSTGVSGVVVAFFGIFDDSKGPWVAFACAVDADS